jgi:hypothetical protein
MQKNLKLYRVDELNGKVLFMHDLIPVCTVRTHAILLDMSSTFAIDGLKLFVETYKGRKGINVFTDLLADPVISLGNMYGSDVHVLFMDPLHVKLMCGKRYICFSARLGLTVFKKRATVFTLQSPKLIECDQPSCCIRQLICGFMV